MEKLEFKLEILDVYKKTLNGESTTQSHVVRVHGQHFKILFDAHSIKINRIP